MELKNLQIHFHDKDHLKHRITYVNKNGTPCTDTLYSGVEFAQHVINCLEAVPTLRRERDDALKLRESYNSNVEDWRELCSYFNLPVSELSSVMKAIDTMRLERDMLRAEHKVLSDLNEIRYVLHGDIQPCTVLYSDDTTTLLRLDEGDIMCETDTIEWSDSVMYRCQELLRGEAKRSGHRVSLPTVKAVAQLVRDERILLNDDALEASGVAKLKTSSPVGVGTPVKTCPVCTNVYDSSLGICPQCHTPTRS